MQVLFITCSRPSARTVRARPTTHKTHSAGVGSQGVEDRLERLLLTVTAARLSLGDQHAMLVRARQRIWNIKERVEKASCIPVSTSSLACPPLGWLLREQRQADPFVGFLRALSSGWCTFLHHYISFEPTPCLACLLFYLSILHSTFHSTTKDCYLGSDAFVATQIHTSAA